MAKTGTKQISATIPAEHYDALDEFHWAARKNLSQVIADAVAEYIEKHNIPVVVPDEPAAPAADEKAPKAK